MPGYTALPTKNPGDLLTSALWNTYLQGNADSGFERPIAEVELASPAASVVFSSIPQTFAHLKVIWRARSALAATNDNVDMRFNGLSASAYYAAPPAAVASAAVVGIAPAASATANVFGGGTLWVTDYTQSASYMTWHSLWGSVYVTGT